MDCLQTFNFNDYYHLMKQLLILLALLPCWLSAQVTSPQTPGPFRKAFTNVTFTDTVLADPTVSGRIYYPGVNDGFNEPMVGGIYPIIVFGHGFQLLYEDYENLCFHLATWGYIVMSPNVQNGFAISHGEFAREMAACLRYLQNEGSNPSSQFFGAIGFKQGAFGHSMGGGAVALLTGEFPGLDAVIGLAAAETNPSAIAALGSYTGPYMVISGKDDNVADEASNQLPMYTAAQGPKVWVSLVGGAHCKFTDDAVFICDIVSNPGTLSRARQQELSNRYTTAFFNFYLKNDTNYRPFLCGDSIRLDETNNVLTFQSTVPGCPPVVSAEAPAPIHEFVAFPNPSTGSIRLKGDGEVWLMDATGRRLNSFHLVPGLELKLQLQTGIYWAKELKTGRALLIQVD